MSEKGEEPPGWLVIGGSVLFLAIIFYIGFEVGGCCADRDRPIKVFRIEAVEVEE
jgi:hypothetical protein